MSAATLPYSCCEPFVEKHGMPREFARSLFTAPATSLAEYSDQLDKLKSELEAIEACAHYRLHAFEQFTYIRSEEFDNRVWRAEAATAEFCNLPLKDYIQQLAS